MNHTDRAHALMTLAKQAKDLHDDKDRQNDAPTRLALDALRTQAFALVDVETIAAGGVLIDPRRTHRENAAAIALWCLDQAEQAIDEARRTDPCYADLLVAKGRAKRT